MDVPDTDMDQDVAGEVKNPGDLDAVLPQIAGLATPKEVVALMRSRTVPPVWYSGLERLQTMGAETEFLSLAQEVFQRPNYQLDGWLQVICGMTWPEVQHQTVHWVFALWNKEAQNASMLQCLNVAAKHLTGASYEHLQTVVQRPQNKEQFWKALQSQRNTMYCELWKLVQQGAGAGAGADQKKGRKRKTGMILAIMFLCDLSYIHLVCLCSNPEKPASKALFQAE